MLSLKQRWVIWSHTGFSPKNPEDCDRGWSPCSLWTGVGVGREQWDELLPARARLCTSISYFTLTTCEQGPVLCLLRTGKQARGVCPRSHNPKALWRPVRICTPVWPPGNSARPRQPSHWKVLALLESSTCLTHLRVCAHLFPRPGIHSALFLAGGWVCGTHWWAGVSCKTSYKLFAPNKALGFVNNFKNQWKELKLSLSERVSDILMGFGGSHRGGVTADTQPVLSLLWPVLSGDFIFVCVRIFYWKWLLLRGLPGKQEGEDAWSSAASGHLCAHCKERPADTVQQTQQLQWPNPRKIYGKTDNNMLHILGLIVFISIIFIIIKVPFFWF